MSLYKLFKYDIRFGLLRWRYAMVPLVFLVPCIQGHCTLRLESVVGTWVDYMMYCYKGCMPISGIEMIQDIYFPSAWILIMSGCLFVNLDYLPCDLTHMGQQVIIRCVKRKNWFVSKCVWNGLSCLKYYCLGGLTVLAFTIITGGRVSLINDPVVSNILLGKEILPHAHLTICQAVVTVIILPILTMVTLSMLEMSFLLVLKPIVSFIISISMLSGSLFWDSPLILGVGAMTIRNSMITANGVSSVTMVYLSLVVILVCVVFGIAWGSKMDILNVEE